MAIFTVIPATGNLAVLAYSAPQRGHSVLSEKMYFFLCYILVNAWQQENNLYTYLSRPCALFCLYWRNTAQKGLTIWK
jgi:hypothetical protein